MKNITPFALLWAVVLLGWGCRKDVEDFRPYPNTLSELSFFLNQVPDTTTTTTFHFNGLNEDKILATPSGVRVFLTDVDQLFSVENSLSPIACSACTDLKFVITIASTKGDILSRELPTYSTENMLLESGGMVQLKAYCGTTALQLLPGRTIKIQLPAANSKDNMFVYTDTTVNDHFTGWKNTGQQVFKADWPAPPGSTGSLAGYELIISHLGWTNCARPLSLSTVTPFCISLEPSYTGLNTQAYLVFENVLVVASLKFDDASHTFCFPNVPAGYPVKIITVAKLGSEYWLGTSVTETGTNSMLSLLPQKQEASEVLGYLRGL